MAISGSENEYKYSYHITLNNYMSLDSEDKNSIKKNCKIYENLFLMILIYLFILKIDV